MRVVYTLTRGTKLLLVFPSVKTLRVKTHYYFSKNFLDMIIKISEDKKEIVKPEDIYRILTDCLKSEDKIDQDKEHFWVFHLDCRNKIKLLELVSLGTLNSSLVHPREVFTRAVGEISAQIIIAHNHPSGEANPSDDDITLTKRLVKAGELLGIELIDHIIVANSSFISLKEKSLI